MTEDELKCFVRSYVYEMGVRGLDARTGLHLLKGSDRSRSRPPIIVRATLESELGPMMTRPSPDAVPPCGLAWRCPPVLCSEEVFGWDPMSLQRWWDRSWEKEKVLTDTKCITKECDAKKKGGVAKNKDTIIIRQDSGRKRSWFDMMFCNLMIKFTALEHLYLHNIAEYQVCKVTNN